MDHSGTRSSVLAKTRLPVSNSTAHRRAGSAKCSPPISTAWAVISPKSSTTTPRLSPSVPGHTRTRMATASGASVPRLLPLRCLNTLRPLETHICCSPPAPVHHPRWTAEWNYWNRVLGHPIRRTRKCDSTRLAAKLRLGQESEWNHPRCPGERFSWVDHRRLQQAPKAARSCLKPSRRFEPIAGAIAVIGGPAAPSTARGPQPGGLYGGDNRFNLDHGRYSVQAQNASRHDPQPGQRRRPRVRDLQHPDRWERQDGCVSSRASRGRKLSVCHPTPITGADRPNPDFPMGLCCGTLCSPRFWQSSSAALDKGLTIRTGEMSSVEPPVR